MIALYLTIFISLILALIFLVLFFHSSRHGQYEDTYTPSIRMLFDEEFGPEEENSINPTEKTDNTNT